MISPGTTSTTPPPRRADPDDPKASDFTVRNDGSIAFGTKAQLHHKSRQPLGASRGAKALTSAPLGATGTKSPHDETFGVSARSPGGKSVSKAQGDHLSTFASTPQALDEHRTEHAKLVARLQPTATAAASALAGDTSRAASPNDAALLATVFGYDEAYRLLDARVPLAMYATGLAGTLQPLHVDDDLRTLKSTKNASMEKNATRPEGIRLSSGVTLSHVHPFRPENTLSSTVRDGTGEESKASAASGLVQPTRVVLPPTLVSSRDGARVLEASLSERLLAVQQAVTTGAMSRNGAVVQAQGALDDIAHELTRQTAAQCEERARLLAKLWIKSGDLVAGLLRALDDERRRHKEAEEEATAAAQQARRDYAMMVDFSEKLIRSHHDEMAVDIEERALEQERAETELRETKDELRRVQALVRRAKDSDAGANAAEKTALALAKAMAESRDIEDEFGEKESELRRKLHMVNVPAIEHALLATQLGRARKEIKELEATVRAQAVRLVDAEHDVAASREAMHAMIAEGSNPRDSLFETPLTEASSQVSPQLTPSHAQALTRTNTNLVDLPVSDKPRRSKPNAKRSHEAMARDAQRRSSVSNAGLQIAPVPAKGRKIDGAMSGSFASGHHQMSSSQFGPDGRGSFATFVPSRHSASHNEAAKSPDEESPQSRSRRSNMESIASEEEEEEEDEIDAAEGDEEEASDEGPSSSDRHGRHDGLTTPRDPLVTGRHGARQQSDAPPNLAAEATNAFTAFQDSERLNAEP